MWCRSHQGGWVQPGKLHPASRAINAMVWPAEASRRVLPSANGTPFPSMIVGQMLGFIRDPQELITGELAAVGGLGHPGLSEQILEADGDDHRCRYPADGGLVGGFEEPGAGLLQRVVQALHVRPLVGKVDDGAVLIFDRCAAGFRQRVEDRVELGAHGGAESTGEMPHAVPPLLEFEVAAVLLQLVIDRLRPVGVGGVDHGVGEPLQLRRRQDGCVVGEQLFGLINVLGLHVVAGELVHGPFHNGHFLRAHRTVALQCGQPRQHRVKTSAEHRSTGPDGSGRTDPGRGVAGGELNTRTKNWTMVDEQYSRGRSDASASAIIW